MLFTPVELTTIIDFDWWRLDNHYDYRNGTGLTIGNLIEVGSEDVTITHLGVHDPDGRNISTQNRQVGLWNKAGDTLIASVTVTASDLIRKDNYRYHELTSPVTLSADTRYLIGGEATDGFWDADIGGGASTGTNPFMGNRLTIIESRFFSGGFAAPMVSGGLNARWAGGNAIIAPIAPSVNGMLIIVR